MRSGAWCTPFWSGARPFFRRIESAALPRLARVVGAWQPCCSGCPYMYRCQPMSFPTDQRAFDHASVDADDSKIPVPYQPTSPSLGPHRMSLSILCCLPLSFCACRPEVTVTSLHPPRLCRSAVLLSNLTRKTESNTIVSPCALGWARSAKTHSTVWMCGIVPR